MAPIAATLPFGSGLLDIPADMPDDTAVHDALIALHARSVDSAKGFARMVEKAEPSFRGTAIRFHDLHQRQAETLARMLAGMGVEADPDGTLMGTVNATVVSLRAMFDEIDADVMDQVRSGEDWVLAAYDDAIAEAGDRPLAEELRVMRAEVTDLLADTGPTY